MTEKQRRAQVASELNEIMTRLMRDAGVLLRAMCDLGGHERTVAQISGSLKRYGGEHGQAYGGDVLEVVKKYAPARKPNRRRPAKPPRLPSNVISMSDRFH